VFELFYRFRQNLAGVFSGWNLLWHSLAIGLTIAVVMTGGDWAYFCATRAPEYFWMAMPALRLGMVMPVSGPLLLLLGGLLARRRRLVTTAWALGQAALLAYLVTCSYKAFTGREHPPLGEWAGPRFDRSSLSTDSSHGFRFGFLRGGVFWGWPSGHTTVAFSMATCLVALYSRNKMVRIGALCYAFYIGLAVSVTIHWFSEFAAGAIIGSVIGTTVGKSFAPKLLEVE
jgi:membrane-associated phospholipid phosphatase